MASVITVAFENWKAQEAASGKAVLLDEFVFANVPNLDPTQPVDRNEKLPPANQIVHRQAVNKAGLASENAVAYSVTLGAEVGNFDFNWIGLLNKASGTVAMITHAPLQKKLKTQNGQQGNVLTRSFILEFKGAAEETQIKTSAETWQIDFTARLSGIDEMQRLINVDSYGAAAFFNDGFEVTRSGEQYTVKKGLGYVGGLRGELTQNQILNGLRNTKVYADFSYQGNIVSQWNTVVKITSAAALNNYVDVAGFTHQVFAIASIDASGNVKDLRSMGALSSQEISALETRLKLDLSKKIDKANISGVLGNDNDKVPSLNLLATELGKKQPAGNYAPAGDYATNTALKNGLEDKFDKNSVTQSTGTSTTLVMSQDAATKSFLKKGEFGFGGFGADRSFTEAEILAFIKDRATVSQIFRNSNATTSTTYQYAPIFYFKSANTWGAITADIFGRGIKISAGDDERANTYEIWSKRTAIEDRNGYLHSSITAEEMQSVPIGATLIWNSEAPIPANFWPNEGRSFSASEYPELAKIFPTLKLPDDRGYAIRVADNGKNIDAGRKVGTYQEDQIQNITGSIGFVKGIEGATATGAFSTDVKSIESSGHAGTTFGQGGSYNFDAGRVARTGNETRMKNVAKILITRVR
ncbi:phage tail protein [Providencia huaxiensis]|uniref:phage tail-collar fiber domain-containing protein n=1 Tax=Providencia huaxiensis TaxID=2027290 RepID=UPI001E5785B1|nr:phage tail protein [Providencia huaxiensis]MCD2527319.1 phage tail protein [Providencia huaxiensis]